MDGLSVWGAIMFEGAVLLRGLLLPLLAHPIRAADSLKYREQCGAMLAAADGRASAASAAAAVQFRTSPTTAATLEKLGEDVCV